MKTNKGFTLIEIMIVIAIIGILALVLVPKIGAMKDQAKLAGVDTNMRVVEAIAQGMLSTYKASTIADFETQVTSKLPTDVENPLTNATKDPIPAVSAVVAGNTAFAYLGDADHQGAPVQGTDIPSTDTDLKGVVAYATWTTDASSSDVNITLYPYDELGQLITAKVKTLTK